MDRLPWTGTKQFKRIANRKDVIERLWIIPQRLAMHSRMLFREKAGLLVLQTLETLDGLSRIEVGRQLAEPGSDLDCVAEMPDRWSPDAVCLQRFIGSVRFPARKNVGPLVFRLLTEPDQLIFDVARAGFPRCRASAPQHPGGHATGNRHGGNVPRDHRSGGDHRTISNRGAIEDYAIGADPDIVTDHDADADDTWRCIGMFGSSKP